MDEDSGEDLDDPDFATLVVPRVPSLEVQSHGDISRFGLEEERF